MAKETVTMSRAAYEELIKDQAKLRALESGGVDNWDWYSQSLSDAGWFKKYDPDSDEEDEEE